MSSQKPTDKERLTWMIRNRGYRSLYIKTRADIDKMIKRDERLRVEENRPKRLPKGMTPPQYYRKYRATPFDYLKCVNGRYYCNPAHCSRSWKSKEERDKHLDRAYDCL